MEFVSVVVPVFNEEAAIREDLDRIAWAMKKSGLPHEIIVVDDGSIDRTADIVAERDDVALIRHPRNLGTGAATKTGIRHARGDVVIMTDGDGTYPNHLMPALLAHMNAYDMVVGARVREAGTLRWLRTPAKTFIRLLASYLTETPIPDLNSGLRCFRKDMALRFFPILPAGHSWVSTITLAFLSSGYQVKYVPIDYYPRKGQSSFHPIADTYSYLALVMRTIMFFNPLKFFLPVALLLLALGLGKTVADIVRYNWHIASSTVMLVLTGVQVGAIGALADLIVKRSRLP